MGEKGPKQLQNNSYFWEEREKKLLERGTKRDFDHIRTFYLFKKENILTKYEWFTVNICKNQNGEYIDSCKIILNFSFAS